MGSRLCSSRSCIRTLFLWATWLILIGFGFRGHWTIYDSLREISCRVTFSDHLSRNISVGLISIRYLCFFSVLGRFVLLLSIFFILQYSCIRRTLFFFGFHGRRKSGFSLCRGVLFDLCCLLARGLSVFSCLLGYLQSFILEIIYISVSVFFGRDFLRVDLAFYERDRRCGSWCREFCLVVNHFFWVFI